MFKKKTLLEKKLTKLNKDINKAVKKMSIEKKVGYASAAVLTGAAFGHSVTKAHYKKRIDKIAEGYFELKDELEELKKQLPAGSMEENPTDESENNTIHLEK